MSDTFDFSRLKKKKKKNQTPKSADEAAASDSKSTNSAETELSALSEASLSATAEFTSVLPPSLLATFDGVLPPQTREELEAFFPSEHEADATPISEATNSDKLDQEEIMSFQAKLLEAPTSGVSATDAMPRREERRRKRRVKISAPVRVRAIHLTQDCPDETTTTVNISRNGLLFHTRNTGFEQSMDLAVTLPYSSVPGVIQAEQPGRVVWVSQNSDGTICVAVALGSCPNAEVVRGYSDKPVVEEQIEQSKVQTEAQVAMHMEEQGDAQSSYIITFDRRDPATRKPLVLLLDADSNLRDCVKSYLNNEGYEVVTVSTAEEARNVLNRCTPSLVVAEIEGEGMPGYDICTHCKGTPRLQSVPVLLMTSSAYPSDYASAHSLGAVVCMAKPFKQERLGHVVRLLAPPLNVNDNATPPRPADPSRRACRPAATPKAVNSTLRRFKFFKS